MPFGLPKKQPYTTNIKTNSHSPAASVIHYVNILSKKRWFLAQISLTLFSYIGKEIL
jgi:hypothetical protein